MPNIILLARIIDFPVLGVPSQLLGLQAFFGLQVAPQSFGKIILTIVDKACDEALKNK
jgi:hypothetical protein